MPPLPVQNHRRRMADRVDLPPLPSSSSSKNAPANGRNNDTDLFKNLVEIVPLVESLMDRRANPSSKRRASVIYTRAPTVSDSKGKKSAQPVSAVKLRNNGDNVTNECALATNTNSTSSSNDNENVEKNTEEIIFLREKLEDLHKLLAEKDEALKSKEKSTKMISSEHATLDELRRSISEKENLLKITNSELSNAQNTLEERQAHFDKLNFEARATNKKVQELQYDLDSMHFEKFAYSFLFQELSENKLDLHSEENITYFQPLDHLPHVDDMTEAVMEQMEEARLAYTKAVSIAKESPTEDNLTSVLEARSKLESFVL